MSGQSTRSKLKFCVCCEETKEAHLCVPRLNVCKECKNDPTSYLVRDCSICKEEKLWPSEFKGRVCRKCSYKPTIHTKSCVSCKKEKELSSFTQRSDVCKDCMEDPEVYLERRCTVCDEVKSLKDDFPKRSWRCKKCSNKKPSVNRTCKGCGESKKRADFKRGQEYCLLCENKNVSKEKTCRECGLVKPDDEFRPNRRKCKDCERKHGRNYRRTTTTAKAWAENNKEQMKHLQKEWYETNKPEIRQKERKRMQEDPIFREIKTYRTSMGKFYRGVIQQNHQVATNKDNFLEWLEFSFAEGMDFKNHGTEWQIDHVLPLELKFKYRPNEWCWKIIEEEDAFDCLYMWYNTFPLFSADNRSKSQTINGKVLIAHLKHLQTYIKHHKIEKDKNYFRYVNLINKIIDAAFKK